MQTKLSFALVSAAYAFQGDFIVWLRAIQIAG